MKLRLAACVATLLSFPAFGYETDTHALVTSYAYGRSTLASPALMARLGLDRFSEDTPFRVPGDVEDFSIRDAYFDFLQMDWEGDFEGPRRRIQSYERGNMFSASGENFRVENALQERTRAWLMRGAIREDDLRAEDYLEQPIPDPDPYGEFIRVYQHFYDPVHNSPLATLLPCPMLPGTLGACTRSPDWAFGIDDVAGAGSGPPSPMRRNHFTWADAKEGLWCALTRNIGNRLLTAPENAAERRLCWATTMKSLGHVLHLAQDLAQPQHVRNDRHNPPHAHVQPPVATLPTRRHYELFTNYRATGGGGSGEVSSPPDERPSFRTLFGAAATTPINVGLGYPIPAFATPVRYFTTRQVETGTDATALRTRRGLGDFTNRTFFSEGTLFSTDFPLPPVDPASSEFEVSDRVLTSVPGFGQLTQRELTGALVDPLRGAYVDTVLAPFGDRVPVATLGLWADFDTGQVTQAYPSITLEQYAAHADVLVPRAIAYSAGLIDYFFRGKLEVTAPADGLFSVIDHGTPHTFNASLGYPIRMDDGNVFGFTRVRMRVKNDTAEVNESGTSTPIPRNLASPVLPGGAGVPTMMAVARFHRNRCYQPSLTTERTVTFDGTINFPDCADGRRTPYQEIVVSRAVAGDAAMLNGAGQDLTFDFSQEPIPVNATDVILQVVYRGPLGLEQDAIVVGSFDVREPSYFTLWNNTDYAGCNGNWVTGSVPGCNYPGGITRVIQTARLCIGEQRVYQRFGMVGGIGPITTASYARLAALLDDHTHATRARLIVGAAGAEAPIRDRSITGQARQSAKEAPTAQAPYLPDAMYLKRGVVGSFRPQPWYLIIGADPQPSNDMGPNDIGALTQPFNPPAMAATGGEMDFPEVTPPPQASCTSPSLMNEPYYEDEIEAWFRMYGETGG